MYMAYVSLQIYNSHLTPHLTHVQMGLRMQATPMAFSCVILELKITSQCFLSPLSFKKADVLLLVQKASGFYTLSKQRLIMGSEVKRSRMDRGL